VAFFDCLHDMGDTVGAAAHVRQSLAKDGTWMIVEPFANDQLKDNLNPAGRVYYSLSTLLCTPCSRSQEVALCLGAQARETRIREAVTSAGFTRFRRATETAFNIVYEARPSFAAKGRSAAAPKRAHQQDNVWAGSKRPPRRKTDTPLSFVALA
jgi:hypothetical protein